MLPTCDVIRHNYSSLAQRGGEKPFPSNTCKRLQRGTVLTTGDSQPQQGRSRTGLAPLGVSLPLGHPGPLRSHESYLHAELRVYSVNVC